MVFIFGLLLQICFTFYFAMGDFDYQVGGRVQDNLVSFFNYVTKASEIPQIVISSKMINITDPYSAGPKVLFPSMKANAEYLSTWFYGLETGFALIYYSTIPSVATTISNGQGNISQWVEYKFNSMTGVFGEFTGNKQLYDVKSRSWYQECKNANMTIWTRPFFTFGSLQPAVAIAHPIFNQTINGENFPGFAGVLATETSLQGISNYLYKFFHGTDKEIFIVDMETLYLMATSWNAPLSYDLGPNKHYIRANESSDELISAVTSKLMKHDWSQQLYVLENNYVQCQRYSDEIPGIDWYVVIVMPATIDPDHILVDSPMSQGILALAIIAMLFVALSGAAVLYYFKTKLFKLTRPVFTVVILIGGFLLGVYCLLLIGANTRTSCAVRPWLFNLSFSFAFSPLLIKSWRVHVMFNVNPFAKKQLISTGLLLSYTLPLVLVDALILGLTLYVGGKGTNPFTEVYSLSNGAYAELTYCSYVTNNTFFLTEITFKGILILIACALSFLIRKINGAIAGGKALIVIIYNIAFVSGVVLLIDNAISKVETRLFIQVIGICYCIVITATVLVWPTVYEILTVGDEAAAAEVMDDLFDSARPPKLERHNSSLGKLASSSTSKSVPNKVYISPVGVKPIPEVPEEQERKSSAS